MVTFPSVLAMPLQMQPRIRFAFFAAAVLCWLMLSLLSTRVPRSLSARLLRSHTDPSLSWTLRLPHPRYRTSQLSLYLLHWERFHLYMKEFFFFYSIILHWNNLPRVTGGFQFVSGQGAR